jgi:hypothetical protein
MITTNELELVQTCGACPEQYDVFLNDMEVGYLRLRHGYFRAECFGNTVYAAYPKDDGIFEYHERAYYLNKAKEHIVEELNKSSDKMYTKKEVHNLMTQAWIHGQSKPDCHYTVRENWIEQNL